MPEDFIACSMSSILVTRRRVPNLFQRSGLQGSDSRLSFSPAVFLV